MEKIVSSRYPNHQRPRSWDLRKQGEDIVVSSSGEQLRLLSNPQQPPPQKGWTILLRSGSPELGFEWTLYGMPDGAGIEGLEMGMSKPPGE